MKKILIYILLLTVVSHTCTGQTIKISALPTHSTSPSGAFAPIVISGVTKKFDLGNFVYTGGSYANPSWITSLAASKITQGGATTGQGLIWNGSSWVPGNLNSAIPANTGQNGKFLGTNGTTNDWTQIDTTNIISFFQKVRASLGSVALKSFNASTSQFLRGDGSWAAVTGFVPTTGGTMTGDLEINNGTNIIQISPSSINSDASTFYISTSNDLSLAASGAIRLPYLTEVKKSKVLYFDPSTKAITYGDSAVGGGGGGGGTWGSITGTLSSQTDLQAALNTKYSSTDTALTVATKARAKFYIDSLHALLKNQYPALKQQVPYVYGTAINANGASYTEGYNASSYQKNFVSQIGNVVGTMPTNFGRAGRGIFANVLLARSNQPTVSNTKALILGELLNDLRRGNNGYKTYNKMYYGVQAYLANAFLASAIPASSGSITRAGTWSAWSLNCRDSAAGKAETLSGTAMKTSTTNDSLTYVFTTYDNVIISVVAGDGVAFNPKDFRVILDGYNYGTFSTAGWTDGIGDDTASHKYLSVPIYIKNLVPGATHTLTIRAMGTGGSDFVIDYIGHLQNPKDSKPVIVSAISKMPQAGYAQLFTGYGNIVNDTIIDIANEVIKNAIRNYGGYPVAWADPNKYLNKATDFATDNLHPNDSGHTKLANCYLAAWIIQAPTTVANDTTVTWVSDASGTITLDCGNAMKKVFGVYLTSTGRTVTLTNALQTGVYTIKVYQDATGGRNIGTWTNGWFEAGGTIPLSTPTAGAKDLAVCMLLDGKYWWNYKNNFQ